MSNPPDTNADTPFDLGPGLVEFYSSQATLMLSQYKNIERLLGPTDDWTAPGSYCEILLRDFLRAHLPSYYSADKGFIYGRRQVGDADRHCPEIDILVHDNHHYRPLLHIGDFVVVQAKATYGAIQVKRRMERDQLKKALTNLFDAREHLIVMCRDISRSPLKFFSAVVFFDEKSPGGDRPSETYRACIEERFSDPQTWQLAPDFIGSLQHHFYRRSDYGINRLRYAGYPACVNHQNIAVQFLLWIITHIISGHGTQPPMVVAPMMKAHQVDSIEITAPSLPSSGEEYQKGGQP
jgi:hypothetical protein